MGSFIFGIIFVVLAAAWWALSRNAQGLPTAARSGGTAVASVVGAILILVSIITVVDTKNVGVVTQFREPVGTLTNGLHFIAPWQSVTEMDGAIQTDSYVGEHATVVRIGNQSTAKVDNSIRWRIIPDQADELFRDYRDFDKIRDSLVTRQLNDVINDVFASYDPLQVDENGQVGVISTEEFSEEVTTRLQDRIGTQIEVLDVIIPFVAFDDATQSRINAYQEEIGNTRIAVQKQRTAEAQAEANRILSDSVSDDPNVLVAQCLDTLATMVEKNRPVPAGFSCWPGSGSTLVVPSTTPAKDTP